MKFECKPYGTGYMLLVPVGDDRTIPLIDGKTGDISVFDKKTIHAFNFGKFNELGHICSFLTRNPK